MEEINGPVRDINPGNVNDRKISNLYWFCLAISFVLFFCYFYYKSYSQSTTKKEMGKIEVGSILPSFTLKDQFGKEFDLERVKGKKNLVIYFYPKDDSPGCTKEACSFRDQFDVFSEADALIIGISGQSVKSHADFAAKYRLNFTLLSDEGNKVRKLFNVPTNLLGLLPGRVTYVADKKGKVVFVFNSQINAQKHIDEALRILNELK